MRLLIVEDEAAIRSALARGLGHGGVEVLAAASLIEARQLAARDRPEALLSDLKLPDGSGLDLACELGLPFMLMSGYASYDDAVQALRMGCVDFFTKPVSIKDLRRAVERLQARIRVDSLQIFDPAAQPRVVRSAALGLMVEPFSAQAISWSSRDQAQEVFDRSASLAPERDERHIMAELMQSIDRGRLVVNSGETWWHAWLEAPVDWQDAQSERRRVIEDLAERCVWRAEGALVECSHG